MFGILTVCVPEQLPLGRRMKLRLRPGSNLRCEEGLFRMAMFTAAEVTLSPRWPEALRQKRVSAGLRRLREKGVRQAVLPEEWVGLAKAFDILPVRMGDALEGCASQAVLEACRGLGLLPRYVRLTVYGGELSPQAMTQLLTLSRTVGEIVPFCPGGQELARRLAREDMLLPEDAPVVALRLQGGKLPAEGFVIDLCGAEEPGPGVWTPGLLPPEGALARMPEGADPGHFAAALLACGAIQAREIRMIPLDIPQSALYNKTIPVEEPV